jgi:hypothetical protein
MQLAAFILETLRAVHDHDMNVMAAFDAISEKLSEEFDKINDSWAKELDDLDF